MILIGEKLNSSIPRTFKALSEGDTGALVGIIRRQTEAGADYLDINAALCGGEERAKMKQLIELVIEHSDCGIMLDSPSAGTLAECSRYAGDRSLIINSVTASDRLDELEGLLAELGAGVVVMPMRDRIPESAGERVKIAGEVIGRLRATGVREDNIYVDAIVETLSTRDHNPRTTLDTIIGLRREFPGVHALIGTSNVSFGLPGRAAMNATFLAMAIACGADSAIMDVCSPDMRRALMCARALGGQDEYCMDYIMYMRENQL